MAARSPTFERAMATDDTDIPEICQVCDGFVEREGVRADWTCACDDIWCSACIIQAYSVAARDKGAWPIRCLCGEIIRLNSVKHILPEAFLQVHGETFAHWSARQPLYCAKESCSAFLVDQGDQADSSGQSTPQDRFVLCGDCGSKTCADCKSPKKAHTRRGNCREQNIGRTRQELVAGSGWRACRCGHVIERNGGCLHMACLSCAYQFCFSCGAEWKRCDCPEVDTAMADAWDADDGWGQEDDPLPDPIVIAQARLNFEEVQVRVVDNGRLREVHVQVGQRLQLGPVYVQVLGPGAQVAHNMTQIWTSGGVNEVTQ